MTWTLWKIWSFYQFWKENLELDICIKPFKNWSPVSISALDNSACLSLTIEASPVSITSLVILNTKAIQWSSFQDSFSSKLTFSSSSMASQMPRNCKYILEKVGYVNFEIENLPCHLKKISSKTLYRPFHKFHQQ